jgi:putative peptidoglycan lipid II flippase
LGFGLPAFIMIKILVVPFFANENTKTPIKISLFCIAINLILNLILIGHFLHVGLAIATSVSAWINMTILIYFLVTYEKYSFDKSIFTLIFKVLLASTMMAIVLYFVMDKGILSLIGLDLINENILLIITIILGLLTYLVSSYIIGVEKPYNKKWRQE